MLLSFLFYGNKNITPRCGREFPKGCQNLYPRHFIPSYFILKWRIRLASALTSLAISGLYYILSLLIFPHESVLFQPTKINCLWNQMNQSTPPPLPFQRFTFFHCFTYLKESLCVSPISLQVGHFFHHPLYLLFLASRCFPVVMLYFELWVAEFEDDGLTAGSWIIWDRLGDFLLDIFRGWNKVLRSCTYCTF